MGSEMCIRDRCALNAGTPRRTEVVITGGWCVAKKKEHTYRGHHLPWRKKKGKKKEVPSIELANFDWIVRWFYPLRYSGIN